MYPETVKQANRWLDGTGGPNSVLAAVLRQADGSGLARGSNWCPGLDTDEGQPEASGLVLPRNGDVHASPSYSGMSP